MIYNPTMSHKITKLAIIIILLTLVTSALPQTVTAQDDAVWVLLESLNAYRAANGLPPLQVNSQLMAAAQSQADYLAATYNIESGADGHTGAGGSRPIDRAYSFGYGNGLQIDVSENWAGLGPATTAAQVVYNPWWSDAAHQNTMLDGWGVSYTDVGIGVAKQGIIVYYVIDVGAVTSDQPFVSPSGVGSSTGAFGPSNNSSISLLETAAPAADGSVTHTVQEGETLELIARSYGVDVSAIQELNNMPTGYVIIYPDQKLLIKPAGSADESEIPTATLAGPTATVTPVPTFTPRPRPTKTLDISLTPEPIIEIVQTKNELSGRQTLGLVIAIVCGLGLVGFIGLVFRRAN
jgi:uncharacterized protein YkwD